MGLQGLPLRRVAQIEQQTGLVVLRATVNSAAAAGRYWTFITADHRHGWYEPRGDRAWQVGEPGAGDHLFPMCDWLFGDPPRPWDDTWGRLCADGVWRVWQIGTRVPDVWLGPGHGVATKR